LIEVIRQLTSVSAANSEPLRVLVCSASNLAVDNILERLLALPVAKSESRLKVTRVGHPARVMSDNNVLDSTLDVKAGRSDEVSETVSFGKRRTHDPFARRHLQKMSKTNWRQLWGCYPGKARARKENLHVVWNERKCGKKFGHCERSTSSITPRNPSLTFYRIRYRKREGGVVESVLSDSQLVVSTCHSSGGRQLYNHSFDVVIVDEATQAMEAVSFFLRQRRRRFTINSGLLDTDIQGQKTDPCGRPDATASHHPIA
jgi:DNA polymerase alpha-associated DNA helicase A